MNDTAETTATSVQPGNVLAGKYRLEHEIGRGAMGTVWVALHLSLDQKVAIKVISGEHAASDDLRRRFSTEAKAAAKLRSRYVVGVYDDGETPEGLPYIVMEYLEGECLEDRIARNGTIPLPEAARIAKHIGRALTRAHSRAIVHRDLKPGNVFITKNEDDDEGWLAKVLDFGIAKMDDFGEKSTTKTGTVLGTPLFMSPEQVRGASSVDHRADLYSLGMVVYNMLTGGYAFDGESFGDLLVSICTERLPRLCDAAPWLPEALDPWFQKACARNPAERFRSADEMVEALHQAANLPTSGNGLTMVEDSSVFSSPARIAKTQPGLMSPGAEDAASRKAALSSSSPATVTIYDLPKRRSLWWVLAAALVVVGTGAFFVAKGAWTDAPSPPTAQAAQEPSPDPMPTVDEPRGDDRNDGETVPSPTPAPETETKDETLDEPGETDESDPEPEQVPEVAPTPQAKKATTKTWRPPAKKAKAPPAAPGQPSPPPSEEPDVDLGF